MVALLLIFLMATLTMRAGVMNVEWGWLSFCLPCPSRRTNLWWVILGRARACWRCSVAHAGSGVDGGVSRTCRLGSRAGALLGIHAPRGCVRSDWPLCQFQDRQPDRQLDRYGVGAARSSHRWFGTIVAFWSRSGEILKLIGTGARL